MNDAYLEAPTSEELTTEHLAAGADRRFYAFFVDCLVAWGVIGGEAYAAYTLLIEPGRLWTGVAAIAGTVLLVWLIGSMLVGIFGLTPGKALVGIRVLSFEDARPVGLLRAMLRTLVLGLATLPTLGFGAAALAWTAMVDPSGWRRGWHDLRTGSVVVDVRPVPAVEEPEEEAPRQVVNLTAMRLVPASPTPPAAGPDAGQAAARAAARGRRAAGSADGHAAAGPGLATGRGGPGRLAGPFRGCRARAAPEPRRRQLRRATAPSRARPTPPRRRCGGRSPSTPASSSRCVA